MVRKKILLVEDSDAVKELLGGVLKEEGYSVDFASDGGEALKILDRRFNGFDLLIVDNKMPGMDGIKFLERLRRYPDGVNIPVIMLTDSSDEKSVTTAKELNVSGYFLKSSFDYKKFKKLLQSLLKGDKGSSHSGFQIPSSSKKSEDLE